MCDLVRTASDAAIRRLSVHEAGTANGGASAGGNSICLSPYPWWINRHPRHADLKVMIFFILVLNTALKYRADGVDGPQEMERNLAAARHSWARQHAWLWLTFFSFPVGHPPHPPCTLHFYHASPVARSCCDIAGSSSNWTPASSTTSTDLVLIPMRVSLVRSCQESCYTSMLPCNL